MKKYHGVRTKEDSWKAEKGKVCEEWEECQINQQGFILYIRNIFEHLASVSPLGTWGCSKGEREWHLARTEKADGGNSKYNNLGCWFIKQRILL